MDPDDFGHQMALRVVGPKGGLGAADLEVDSDPRRFRDLVNNEGDVRIRLNVAVSGTAAHVVKPLGYTCNPTLA